MTTSRVLAIITVATLPLAALTARGFLVAPQSEADTAELKTYEGGAEQLAAARKVAAEPSAAPADPVGWGMPRKSRPADEPLEYQVAAALAAAGRAAAATGDAILDVTATVTEIDGLLAESRRAEILALPGGQGLLESLQARRAGLKRHTKWLQDRADIARRTAALEALLAGPPDGMNEKKCLGEIHDIVVQFPTVVDDEDPTEPPNARTESQEQDLEGLRSRALFRQEQHAAMTAAAPEDKLRLLDTFLKDHPSAPDPRDARLLDEARRELGVATLAVYRAQAERAETADAMAKALKNWLAAPPAGPDNRKAEALAVIKTWLKGNVPEPPQVAELAKLRNLQETIMLNGGAEQRMLGVFAPTPNQGGKWRYWRDSEDQKDEDYRRGRGDVTVPAPKAPLEIPVFVDIEVTYRKARDKLLGNPLGDGIAKAFAQQSGELADRIAAHRALPPNTNVAHPLQDSYEELGEAIEGACRRATLAAQGFELAAHKNGLRDLLLP
jgi:hypothetical protein